MLASVEIANDGKASASSTVGFALFDAHGHRVGAASPSAAVIVGAKNTTVSPTVEIVIQGLAELWSIRRPYLYTLVTTLKESGDTINTSVGLYTTNWTGDQGLFMNERHIKVRGFCNHDSFGGVGMVIPDRVNLYRAQALKSIGKFWRPPRDV